MYDVLESCSSVIVVCVTNGSVVDVYVVLKSCKCVVAVCEYNGSLVYVYEDIYNKGECGCGEEREKEEIRDESREEEGIRWIDVCKCSRCV